MASIHLPKKMADSSWMVVLGPPGCGKTTCLLKMLRAELESGTSPRNVAFVSFTRAARLEVLQRVGRDFEFCKGDMPWLRTIHSTAYKLLGLGRGQIMTRKAWREFAGMYGYDLTDPKDAEVELAGGVMEPPRRTEDDVLLYILEWGRNRRLDVERSMGTCPANVSAPRFREFVKRLDEFKARKGLLDFTDILERVLEEKLRPPVEAAFIDEAQDLSPLQIAVVEQWFKPCRKVCVGGDEDQAVYGFQGAEPDWLMSLSKRHMRVLLGQSYRVPACVHALAQKIIQLNRNRIEKRYRPTREMGEIERLPLEQALRQIDGETETLVLARNRMFLRSAAETLFKRRLPYVVEGTGGVCPMSSTTAVRAVRAANRISASRDIDAGALHAMLSQIPSRENELLPHGVKAKVKRMDGVVSQQAMREQLGLGGLIDSIRRNGPTSVLERLASPHRAYFQALLDRYGDIPQPRVRLTSIHSAKGREADLVVVLPDMTRATYNEYCDGASGGNEAENRVAYVAVTRAKKRLVLVNPHTKRYYHYPRAGDVQVCDELEEDGFPAQLYEEL